MSENLVVEYNGMHIEVQPSLCSTCRFAQPKLPQDDSGILVCTWNHEPPQPMWVIDGGVVFRMVSSHHWVGRPLDTCATFEAKAA